MDVVLFHWVWLTPLEITLPASGNAPRALPYPGYEPPPKLCGHATVMIRRARV